MSQIALLVSLIYSTILISQSMILPLTTILSSTTISPSTTILSSTTISPTTTPTPPCTSDHSISQPIPVEMSSRSTKVTVKQLLALIRQQNLTRCVCQLICELECNHNIYGETGTTVYENFKSFENTTEDAPEIDQFRLAKLLGDQYNPERTCGLCDGAFPNCTTPHKVMLNLSKQFEIIQ